MMFVGEGRAGKTSALRSMLGLPYVDTASTVGAEMFDVSVETAVQWKKQDRDIPEVQRVAARWAAWRKENGDRTPPWAGAAAMVSDDNAAASASATSSATSGLWHFVQNVHATFSGRASTDVTSGPFARTNMLTLF